MIVYNKLVRDKIPDKIKNNGEIVNFHRANPEEYRTKLKEKLWEEVSEFTAHESKEELADIREVLHAICAYKNYSLEEIEEIRKDKEQLRWWFVDRIILESAS